MLFPFGIETRRWIPRWWKRLCLVSSSNKYNYAGCVSMPRIASYSATYFLARLALRLRLWPNPRLDRASSDEWEDLRDPRFYYYLWEGFSNLFIFLFYLSQFSINEFPVKLMKLNRRNVPFFDVLSICWWNFSNLVEDRDNSDLKHKKKKRKKDTCGVCSCKAWHGRPPPFRLWRLDQPVFLT